MAEQFKPESLTINQLFNNQDSFYKIPEYQRPYRWWDEQLEPLWDDITEAFNNQEPNYFLGSIITTKDRFTYDIVDGQQRLTTLLILFCVIRDSVIDNWKEESDDPIFITKENIQSAIKKEGRHFRIKLTTHANHQSSFEQLINHNTNDLLPVRKTDLKKEDEPEYKFRNTAVFFREKINNYPKAELHNLINYIFNSIYIIRINCTSQDFAMKLFQVLNDRGLDLTTADLFKSSLFSRLQHELSQYPIENSEENHANNIEENRAIFNEKKQQILSNWRDAESKLVYTDISINDALTLFTYYLLAANPKKSINYELTEIFKKNDYKNMLSTEISSFFQRFVTIYYNDIYLSDNTDIYALRYLRWSFYWKAILITAKIENYSEFEKLAKVLTKLYYIHWIAGNTLSSIKDISFKIIGYVKNNVSVDEISKNVDDHIINIKERVKENISSKDVYNTPWIKPLLLIFEYSSIDMPSFIEMNKELHVEHILPRNHKNIVEWNHIPEEISDKYLNSIGNLTLLSGTKNIQASDNPFEKKIGVYNGKGLNENQRDSEKITKFEITKAIYNDYLENKYNKNWTEQSMQDRWNWFIDKFNQIFDFPEIQNIKVK